MSKPAKQSGTKPSVKRVSDITPQRLAELHSGLVETTVLTECLAIDFATLMANCFPDIANSAVQILHDNAKSGITARMTIAGNIMRDQQSITNKVLAQHSSDTVRGWGCYALAGRTELSLMEKLVAIRPFADDPHFGVREWAWLALRADLLAQPETAISTLTGWTQDPSERVRRFACESIRPRGVWCAHFTVLKTTPELALPILEALRSDPSVYVQDSVANWLNDASKTTPEWVQALCARWLIESNTPATSRICKRALRSLNKAASS